MAADLDPVGVGALAVGVVHHSHRGPQHEVLDPSECEVSGRAVPAAAGVPVDVPGAGGSFLTACGHVRPLRTPTFGPRRPSAAPVYHAVSSPPLRYRLR